MKVKIKKSVLRKALMQKMVPWYKTPERGLQHVMTGSDVIYDTQSDQRHIRRYGVVKKIMGRTALVQFDSYSVPPSEQRIEKKVSLPVSIADLQIYHPEEQQVELNQAVTTFVPGDKVRVAQPGQGFGKVGTVKRVVNDKVMVQLPGRLRPMQFHPHRLQFHSKHQSKESDVQLSKFGPGQFVHINKFVPGGFTRKVIMVPTRDRDYFLVKFPRMNRYGKSLGGMRDFRIPRQEFQHDAKSATPQRVARWQEIRKGQKTDPREMDQKYPSQSNDAHPWLVQRGKVR